MVKYLRSWKFLSNVFVGFVAALAVALFTAIGWKLCLAFMFGFAADVAITRYQERKEKGK